MRIARHAKRFPNGTMHFLYFALQDISEPTGATEHVLGLVRALEHDGHEIDVVATAPHGHPGIGSRFHRLDPFRLAPNLPLRLLKYQQALRRAQTYIRELAPGCDVGYSRHYTAARMFHAAGRPLPWIFEVNGLPAEERAARGGVLDPLLAKRIAQDFGQSVRESAHVITVTPELSATTQERYGIEKAKVTVVPNGVDLDRFCPKPAQRATQRRTWGLPEDALVVGYVGNCAAWQRFDLLLDAVASLRDAHPRLQVLIVGDGESRQRWEADVGRRGLAPSFTFTGSVPAEEAPNAFAALDISVDLHHREALAASIGSSTMKIRAAAACGIPSLALEVPGVEFLQSEGIGATCTPTTASLESALGELLADEQSLASMGKRARAFAEQTFGWNHAADTVGAIAQAIARR